MRNRQTYRAATTINTGVTAAGLNARFFPAIQSAPVIWRDVCSVIPSDKAEETYKWLGTVPMPQEWIGDRKTKPLRDFGQTIVNRLWEQTLAIARTEFDDDQTGHIGMRVAEMGTRFAQHPDKYLTDEILKGETNLCYDGQAFFDTDHSEGQSGSQTNDLTYNAAAPDALTDAEAEQIFWNAVTKLGQYLDDEGQPANLIVDPLSAMSGIAVMMYPLPGLVRPFAKLLGVNAAEIISNTTNILKGRARLILNPRLPVADTTIDGVSVGRWAATDQTKVAIFKTDDPIRPFIFQDREAVTTDVIDDPMKKDIYYAGRSRYGVGYGMWQRAVLTTIT